MELKNLKFEHLALEAIGMDKYSDAEDIIALAQRYER